MSSGHLDRATATLKAVAHPARLRILGLLRSGGLRVCQVAATLGAPVSTVSEHLGELKRAGLLVERRDGRWVSYALATEPEAQDLLADVCALIARDPVVRRDERLVRRVRRLPVTKLCDAGLDLGSVWSRCEPLERSRRWPPP